jgi:hypothetical protein
LELLVDGTLSSVEEPALPAPEFELSFDESAVSDEPVPTDSDLLDELSVPSVPEQAARHVIKPANKIAHTAKYKIFFMI